MIQAITTTQSGLTAANVKLTNPVGDFVTPDTPGLIALFDSKSPLIPYATANNRSAQLTLQALYQLSEVSPTQKSCISNILTFAFGGGIDLTGATDDGFTLIRSDIGADAKKEWSDALTELGISPAQIAETSACMERDLRICGNAYLVLKMKKVLDTWRAGISLLDPRETAVTTNGSIYTNPAIRTGIAFNDKAGKAYRVFPAASNTDTSFETVFHVKPKGQEKQVYGRNIAPFYWQLVEYQNSLHATKVSASDFVAKYVVFAEQPAPESDGEDINAAMAIAKEAAQNFKHATQNTGDTPDSVAFNFYPNGLKAPTVEKFDVDRDTDWATHLKDTATDYISGAHGLDKRLIGLAEFSSSLNGSVIRDRYISTEITIVQPIRVMHETFWHRLLKTVFEKAGKPEMTGKAILFKSPLDALISALTAANDTTTKTTDQNGTGDNPIG